jgi:hypothetical protein
MRMINDHTSSKLWCSRLTIPKTCSYFRGANYCNRSRYKACFLGAPLSLKCSLSKHFRLQVHPYPTWRRLTLGAPGLSESGIPQITDSTGVLHGWIVVNQSDFWNFFLACSVSCIDFFYTQTRGFPNRTSSHAKHAYHGHWPDTWDPNPGMASWKSLLSLAVAIGSTLIILVELFGEDSHHHCSHPRFRCLKFRNAMISDCCPFFAFG